MIRSIMATLQRVSAKAFRTIVTKLPDNKDDCPPVVHSRHSKEAHEMLDKMLKDQQKWEEEQGEQYDGPE